MTEPKGERYYASEIEIAGTGQVHTLTYIGSGTTCNVYKTSAKDIVKEFAPIIRGRSAMIRKNHVLTARDDLTPFELHTLHERRNAFDSEILLIDELEGRYRDSDDNMFLVPTDMPDTSIGRCHWCNYVGGKTLQTIFKESKASSISFQHHFLNILPLMISLFDEIAFYHGDASSNADHVGILNLDIKPDNLFVIQSQGEYIGIRNLDFGSLKRIHDKISDDGCCIPGLISSIQHYANEHKGLNRELLFDQIATKYFVSSPWFYDRDRIDYAIDTCLSSEKLEHMVSDLKLLDMQAAWKTFLFAFVDSDDLFAENRWESGEDVFVNAFLDIFENHRLGNHNSLFESYHIYCQLYEMVARSFRGPRSARLTAFEISKRLRNILCLLSGIPDNKKTDEQRRLEAMNHIFCQKDELLSFHGLRSIKDILRFCHTHGLKKREKAENLCRFLRQTDQIDFRLFPNIIYNGNVYSHYDADHGCMRTDTDVPFLRAYRDVHCDCNLLLIGEGSLGKSTSLCVFETEMLCQNKVCLLYECKKLKRQDISEIVSMMRYRKDVVLVFDAYDELPESIREDFHYLIDSLNQQEIQIIISSRFDPRTEDTSVAASEIFSAYQSMYICDFDREQLDSLVSKTISGSSGYYHLLKNTMFLSLHMDLEKHDLLGSVRENIKTEAEFIQQYFERLYLEKTSAKVGIFDLISLGKYTHRQRTEKKNRIEVDIPAPLIYIFMYEASHSHDDNTTRTLYSKHVKFLNYLHALYLKKTLLENHDDMDDEEFALEASKLLNMPSTAEISESIYYAGQLLTGHAEARRILSLLNASEIKQNTRYENILCFFLGYNQDIAEDIPDVFDFYHPVMYDHYHDYFHACDRIRELKANSIKDVRFGYGGFSQLDVIDVDNEIYYTKGNCLIKKSDNGLYIGCRFSEVPDGVTYIHSHSFSYCDIKRVVLPPSVISIDASAFKYCEMLEYVELGEGVNVVAPKAFFKCSALKTLCIKNKNMQSREDLYSRSAFVQVPALEKAIVPTTGISYTYEMAPLSLKYLDISQGGNGSSLVPLTFDDVEQTNRLEGVVIRRDVEYIAEDAFVKFKNNLRYIQVETGCAAYSSIDHCLVSNRERSIILGCKNSKIPKRGIRKIEQFAFARCDIQRIDITEDIESIGAKAFYRCKSLNTLCVAKGLKEVGADAFMHCFNLKHIMISSVDQWSQIFFSTVLSNPLFFAKSLQCDDLSGKVLKLSDGISFIASGAFKDCKGIEKVFIPSSVREIRGCAFFYSDDIKEVHVRDIHSWVSVQFNSFSANPLYQGARLFVDGQEAKHLVFEEKVRIRKFSLVRTKSIETVVLNDGCEVEEDAFVECPNLKLVLLKSKNVTIHKSAFRGCKAIIRGIDSEYESVMQ